MRAFAATIRCVILCVPAARSAPQQSPSPSPSSAQPDLAAGKLVFEGRCSLCHGIDGGGGEDELPPDDVWGAIKALQAESGKDGDGKIGEEDEACWRAELREAGDVLV